MSFKAIITQLNIFILLSFANSLESLAQKETHYFEHLNMEDGLSENAVFSILQDQQGFMWFGTKNGLNRYDGHNFKIFNAESKNPNGLKNNFIYGLFEDSRGTLWVGTANGIYTYDPSTEQFSLFDMPSNKGTVINGPVGEVNEDHQGNIWIAVNTKGFFKFNPKKNSLVQYHNIDEVQGDPPPDNTSSIVIDEKGDIWVGTIGQGVFKYLPETEKFQKYLQNEEVIDSFVLELQDNGPSLLIGTKNSGVIVMDKNTGTCTPLITKDPSGKDLFVRDICKVSDHELWIGTESGLFIYDLEKNKFQNLRENPNDPYSLSDNALYSIFKDREGGMWVGTYFGGVNFLPNHATQFEKHYPITNSNTVSGQRVRKFVEGNDGSIWIGTEDAGLNHLNPETGKFTHFKPSNDPNSISYHNIHGLAKRGNELWIGTFSQGLNVMNLTTNKIKRYKKSDGPGGLHDNDIFTILVDRNNTVWLGTVSGMFRYNDEKDTFDFIEAVGYTFVYDLLEDHKGNIWVGTYSNGLIRLNPENKQVKSFLPDPRVPGSIPHQSIINLFEDSQNRLWIATEGGGFCLYNESNEDFTEFNTNNGYPSNTIYRILEGITGHLWISCNKGLMEFNPQSTDYRLFTKDSGLLPSPFNYKSGFRANDGTLYFGCLNGFISFDPRDFKSQDYNPPIVFTGIQIFNQSVPIGGEDPILTKSITKTSEISLPYDQSSLSFDFAALSYTASESRPYAYKMEGFDQNWTYLSENQRINYSFLPPGKYNLKVKSANIFGEWSNQEGQLIITILPPFWKTTWAYLVYAILGLIGVYLFVKTYNKRVFKKHQEAFKRLEDEKQKEVYQSKIEFFTNITHEIRTPLTLIKGPLESILKKEGEYSPTIKESLWVMNKNVNRLIELSNQLLDFRKTEKQRFSLNFTRNEIGKIIDDIYVRFKGSAEQQLINFHLVKPENPFFADIDREAFTKILSNLFSNAIKNAAHTVQIELLASPRDQHFKVKVSNDGKLIEHELREKIFEPFFQIDGESNLRPSIGTGLGLPLARSLAEMHNGTLYITVKPEEDLNTFILELPIKQENVINIQETTPEPTVTEPEKAKGKEISKTGKPSLLVVEDNKELQKFIYDQLKGQYHVHRAENGQEGLKILDEKPIDLVISDVMMPVMDGFSLCESIKSNVNYSHIPVILLTAKNTVQSKIEGLEMGADVYIEKPFSIEYLGLQVKNLLHYRDQIRQAFANQPMVNVETIAHTRADEEFLAQANVAIMENLDKENFGVNELADTLCMSQSSLLRKIKGISQMTPNGYIRLVRLKKAAEMLQEGQFTVTEISEKVGFNSPSYFSKCFQKQFGELPKDFSKNSEIF